MKHPLNEEQKKPQICSFFKLSVMAFLMFVFSVSNTFAQTRQITGVITDALNDPLIGVSIQVKGSTAGTITDIDGRYSISAQQGNVLVFSYVGFTTQEIAVGNQSTINIKMSEDAQALEEVVVVGYGTLKKKELTSSVETIRADQFNQGGSRNALDLIQGKVAGLNMTRVDGSDPNAGMNIQLRGVSSLSGTRTPLIVIDGIPGGNLDLLQQDDIESVSVLKDGSASAIYGTRGNSGVILITTKKGTAGAPRFDYNAYMQHEIAAKKPDVFSAAEWRDLIKQGVIDASEDFGGSTNLFDELMNKDNFSHYHNFAMSGGTQNTNYRASIYFNEAEGIVKENERQQFGGRVNINQKGLQDRLTVSVNLATNFNKSNLLGGAQNDGIAKSAFEQAIQRNPTAPVKNEDGTFYETFAFNNHNPMSRLANRMRERNQQTTSADVRAKLDIYEGLSASVFGAYQRNSYNDRYYQSLNDWDNREGTSRQGMGYAEKANRLEWQKMLEATVDYRKIFNEVHSITALAGYSYQYSTWERTKMTMSGFTTDAFRDWNMGAGTATNNTQLDRPGQESEKKANTLISFFGRVNYSYADRYHIQGIVRHEGSSKFGTNHKWGTFPSVSGGWTISEEEFMEEVSWLDELKFRVGYGVTGNQGLDEYQSLVRLGTGGVYPQNGVYYQTYGAANNANPDLKWEQKGELNIGIDFAVFDRRITGSIEYFDRNTRDILREYDAQQPPYVRDKIWMNIGTLRSRGLEFQISADAVRSKDFNWGIDFAANTLSNELTKLSSDVFKLSWLEFYGLPSPGNLGNAYRLYEGGSPGDFYGKRFAGFTDEGKWLFYKADGSTARSTELNDDDMNVIGNGVPKFQMSLNNRLTYKNFDLTIMLRGKFAYDILNVKEMYFGNKKWIPNNMFKSALGKHAQLNDDPQYSDYYLEDGSFVKLDNVTLGYTFKLKSPYIRNLRIYATGRNLLTITGYSGMDPELDDTGFEPSKDTRDYYPRTTSLTFGLSLGF
ncbi:MAG: TonB-dependent receptor [Tannerellaceae bacterium]|jgi:TonB-linked SusC/RagA family outer membrane protein|nr:TonB-dependent receptor [Tannerellaceae bacterium]